MGPRKGIMEKRREDGTWEGKPIATGYYENTIKKPITLKKLTENK